MKPSKPHARTRDDHDAERIRELAAEWLTRREDGLDAAGQSEFSAWLGADPRHARAVEQLEAGWRFMHKARKAGRAEAVMQAVDRRLDTRAAVRRRRVWQFSAVGLAAAAVVLGLFVTRDTPEGAVPEIAASVEIKPERRQLPDGSVVELNAGAEIAVEFSPGERTVRLVRGTAHFAVAKDPQRPFVVRAGQIAVRAVGTAFAVRLDTAAIDVLVTEGRVAVDRPAPMDLAAPNEENVPSALVGAGTKIVVPLAGTAAPRLQPQPVAPAEVDLALAWRTRRVEFTAMPLSQVVAHFNRLNAVQLLVHDEKAGRVRISGIFWLDDPEAFSRLIEASAGLQAVRRTPNAIVLRYP